jgi:hypothetical protein
MKVPIKDMSYPNRRKLVTEKYDASMDFVVKQEMNMILMFLRAQNIMRELGWRDYEIHEAIMDTCKYGYKAYEIIYTSNGKHITGLKELDVCDIIPNYTKQLGNFWVQYPSSTDQRILLKDQVLYLSNVQSFNRLIDIIDV